MDLRNALDALPASRVVGVFIYGASGEVVDGCALHVHRVLAVIVVCEAAGPLNYAVGVVFVIVTTSLDTHTYCHGSLRVDVLTNTESMYHSN